MLTVTANGITCKQGEVNPEFRITYSGFVNEETDVVIDTKPVASCIDDASSQTGENNFYDCSAESPKGRRNICYDRQALESRKEHRPENNAIDMVATMGIELLTEEQYRELQKPGNFDMKTSSWVKTPPGIRKLGGAIFADFHYNNVFVYHNGAPSYYAVRGVRGSLIENDSHKSLI